SVAPGLHQRRHLDRDEPAHGDQLGAERAYLRRRRLCLPRQLPQQVRRSRAAANRRILSAGVRRGPARKCGREGGLGPAVAEKIDIFRRVLAGATRAIAKDADADVVFASDAAPASGKTARVPSPGPGLEPKLVAEARGAADSMALRLRHHDPRLHARIAPADADARAVFDALETARVEALGAPSI